jgi:hypothetical protein
MTDDPRRLRQELRRVATRLPVSKQLLAARDELIDLRASAMEAAANIGRLERERDAANAQLDRVQRSLERERDDANDELDRLHRSHAQVDAVIARLDAAGLIDAVTTDPEQWAPFLRFVPPGHFYSPIPRLDEIARHEARLRDRSARELPGIDVRVDDQLALLARLAPHLAGWPFPDEPSPSWRWHGGDSNETYRGPDAAVLHAMLRELRPRRLVEVGSGYSSAMVLDTAEHFLDGATELTFIEPYPELLETLLRPGDEDKVEVVRAAAQDVSLDVFTALAAGDVLFIDSTHVAKTGSDVPFLYGEVLPRLAPGVVVHVHDVFWPFEYPWEWTQAGRAWNELYVLRALLAGGGAFEVLLFSDQLGATAPAEVARILPPAMIGGQAIWLRRT